MAVDKERQVKKLPYPKSVFFIVTNEFCERFSFYGMRTILILYLTEILLYTETSAKMVYHGFAMFVYFFPLLGAILSDSWLGKFRTIFYISIIYAIGSILLALTAIDTLKIPQKEFTIISLLLIAIGTGGIKPCVAAFGGDQFILPQQELQLAMFFSIFYFSINAGSLLSTFITPLLRNNVTCFGNNSCYPLAFAIPGILMVVSICIFGLGKPMYRIQTPKGNVFVNVVSCIWYAVTHRKSGPVDHWLDRSESKYGIKLVSDIKALLKVLVIYIPIPIFWALYDQQGSGWTFQAVRMNGNIGFYTILPDQMQVVNPLLILAFIPMFTYGVYPVLTKCNLLTTPLQRLVCGGFLAAVAFGISAFVSLALEKTYPTLPSSGEAQLRMYDPTNCNYTFTTSEFDGKFTNGYFVNTNIKVPHRNTTIYFTFESKSCGKPNCFIIFNEAKTYGLYLTKDDCFWFDDDIEKSRDGYPLVRTLVSDESSVKYTNHEKSKTVIIPANSSHSLYSIEIIGKYQVNDLDFEVEFKLGGTYTVLVNELSAHSITVTNPNSIHMLWLLIQYVVITAAEIMFSITGLEFAYSQAPSSMKSVLQACWLLTTAFGNLLIVIIESLKLFELQSNEFFLYTGLMVVDIFLLMFLAYRYEYVKDEDSSFVQEDEDAGFVDKKVPPIEGVDNLGFDKHN
ncbi:peptide transporter family 1-like isoform X2 [Euwallacea fornicatus]|uniref:peptide transporter family 1-like isoform X2 n=1 Tax=Euwallacea fornicatus TaxID=995702 RepID=UPI00338EBC3E